MVDRISHDQNFKNLILDYPREALTFFLPAETPLLKDAGEIIPLRQEQLQERLGDRYRELVLHQPHNCGFSVPVMFRLFHISQERAVRREGSSPLASAATRLRDITGTPYGLLCQRPWTALHLLARGKTLPGEARLAMNADKATEPVIMRLMEYSMCQSW